MSKIMHFLSNPRKLILRLGVNSFLKLVNDKSYLKFKYRAEMGKPLNLDSPITYNEKLQWLKLYDRRPEYIKMVDKYEVKEFVSQRIGKEYLIPTLGVWDSFDEIPFDSLPEQFVLKCTHDSGGIVICHDKKKLDLIEARKKLEKSLKHNYFWAGREWPYKDVKPRIIAEKYMEDSRNKELRDYKFFAFDGEVKVLFIATDRQKKEETKFDFFDSQFQHLDMRNGHPNADILPERPQKFDEMIKLAGKLSKGIPHVRVDFYEVDGQIFFGELTFFHWSGMVPFEPETWDEKIGDWIRLPKIQG